MLGGLNPALGGLGELHPLGADVSGRVVVALHMATGRRVVLKFIDRSLWADQHFAERFRAQARVWRQADSEQVVHLFDYVETAEFNVAMLELVDGVSLDGLLEHKAGLAPKAASAAGNPSGLVRCPSKSKR